MSSSNKKGCQAAHQEEELQAEKPVHATWRMRTIVPVSRGNPVLLLPRASRINVPRQGERPDQEIDYEPPMDLAQHADQGGENPQSNHSPSAPSVPQCLKSVCKGPCKSGETKFSVSDLWHCKNGFRSPSCKSSKVECRASKYWSLIHTFGKGACFSTSSWDLYNLLPSTSLQTWEIARYTS